jgi:hypothetical protein
VLQDRRIYESNLHAQLAQWKADIDVLKAKAKRVEADAAVRVDRSIEALQRRHDDVSHHLSSLKVASEEAWESVKADTEKGWLDFKAHLKQPAPPR